MSQLETLFEMTVITQAKCPIRTVSEELCRLARQLNLAVVTEVEGSSLRAFPWTDPEELATNVSEPDSP